MSENTTTQNNATQTPDKVKTKKEKVATQTPDKGRKVSINGIEYIIDAKGKASISNKK